MTIEEGRDPNTKEKDSTKEKAQPRFREQVHPKAFENLDTTTRYTNLQMT